MTRGADEYQSIEDLINLFQRFAKQNHLLLSSFECIIILLSGDNGKEVTPVPMPNTEVKLLSADGSWIYVPLGRCQANETERSFYA